MDRQNCRLPRASVCSDMEYELFKHHMALRKE